MTTLRILRDAVVWLWIGAVMMVSGCAMTLTHDAEGNAALGLFPGLAPGDEVQTLDVQVIGISTQYIDIGYKKCRITRVPSFDQPAVVPRVTTSTAVSDAGIVDELTVGGNQ